MARNLFLKSSEALAVSTAEGRLKGWDDEDMSLNEDLVATVVNPPRERVDTNKFQKFGSLEDVEVCNQTIKDQQEQLESMSAIIRRRRKSTSLTFIKEMLGF